MPSPLIRPASPLPRATTRSPHGNAGRPARGAAGAFFAGSFLPFLSACLAALCLLQGCEGGRGDRKGAAAGEADKDSPAVLTVGTRQVPLADFEKTFWMWSSNRSGIPADTSGVRQFVPQFVESQLIHQMALDSIPELTGTPKDNLEEIEARKMVEIMRQRAFAEANKVDERALKRAYELLGRKLHLRVMVLPSKAEADQAMRGLREGALFDRLAMQKSLDVTSREQGGDIGWIIYTDLDAEISSKLFTMEPGQLFGPAEFDQRYHVYQILEAGTNETRRTFEEERSSLELAMKTAALRRALNRFIDDLFAKYHVKIDPAEVAWMTVFLRRTTADAKRGVQFDAEGNPIGGYVQEATIPWTENPIPDSDSGRVVATYDSPTNGGRITPLRVLDKLIEKPSIGWPTFETSKDTEMLVRNLLLEELEITEAQTLGAASWPEVTRHVAEKREEIRDRVFYRTRVRYRAAVSEAQCRAYYEAHRSEHMEPERRRFIGVNSARWESALKAGDLLRGGKSPEEVFDALAQSDTTVQITASHGTELLAFGQSPLLDRFLFKLPLNGVSDPIPVGYTFTVAKVVEILPARTKDFDEAKEAIQSKLAGAREDSVKALVLADARQKYPVTIHWDVIRKARPTPPAQS